MKGLKRKISKMTCFLGDNSEKRKRRTVHQSSSSSDGRITTNQQDFKFEDGTSSVKEYNGRPTKSLLAKDILNGTSTRQNSPGVVAKLMGLDGMPSPQPAHGQQGRSLGGKRNEKVFNYKSDGRTMKRQKLETVYEDDEEAFRDQNPRFWFELDEKLGPLLSKISI